jgi:hypothetical protein
MNITVPTQAETEGGFIGPLNPYVGRYTARLAPGARAFVSSRSPVRIRRHERGPRVYVAGQRLHHGPAFGMAALLCWRHRWRVLAAAFAGIAATDWRDFPFRDQDNH